MNYQEYKDARSQEITDFPMFFAFSNDQLKEGMAKLQITEMKELTHIGAGGYMRKTDAPAFKVMMDKADDLLTELLKNDEFLTEALTYELSNHEYSYTGDFHPAFDCFGLSYDDERARKIVKEYSTHY